MEFIVSKFPHVVKKRFEDHPAEMFCSCSNQYFLAFMEDWKDVNDF